MSTCKPVLIITFNGKPVTTVKSRVTDLQIHETAVLPVTMTAVLLC